MISSLAKEGVQVAPAWTTPLACLQELSERVVAIERLELAPDCVARRRVCPRVPASPKMYPSRTRKGSRLRHYRQHKTPICRYFIAKPSDGLEPSTPSLYEEGPCVK